jgi:hypothetical protein
MRPEDILMPGGSAIGAPSAGGDETIRDVPGGQQAARAIFDQLSSGGTTFRGRYPGAAVEFPDGGFVGIRGADTDYPTIDVNLPRIPDISKLHF